MKKIIIKVALLSMVFIMLLLVENIIEKRKSNDFEDVAVYVTTMPIDVGSQIKKSMLKEVMLPKHLVSDYIVKDNIEGYLLTSVSKGEFLYHHQISDTSPLKIRESQRLITIKCSILESNGWSFQINDHVDVVMIHGDERILIENAIVSRIFDETLGSNQIPEYVSLIVSIKDANSYFQNISNSRVFISQKSQEGN